MATLYDVTSRSGERGRLVGPLGFWHAAALEQVPMATMLDDPDTAARALGAAARLYDLDLVVAAPVDTVAWAVRAAIMPGARLSAIAAAHWAGTPLPGLPGTDEITDSVATDHLAAVVTRLRSLHGARLLVAVAVPTGATLASSLGPEVSPEWAEDAVGAVLRPVGATEPDAVVRIGEGERSDVVHGLCAYFDIALVEALSEGTGEVSAPTGEAFVDGPSARGRLVVTRTEIPAEADPKAVNRAVQDLRTMGER